MSMNISAESWQVLVAFGLYLLGCVVLGFLSSLLIFVCLIFNLVAEFKAGGLIMKEAMRLPPAAATFVQADVEKKSSTLVLTFDVDGTPDTQKTPLPSEKAKLIQTHVDE